MQAFSITTIQRCQETKDNKTRRKTTIVLKWILTRWSDRSLLIANVSLASAQKKNNLPLGGVNDTGDQYDWATTIYWWALIRLFSRVANTVLGGDVCSFSFRGAALNPTVNVSWRPFAAADLSHGFRMERATVDFTAAKPLFPARQLFRERVKGNVWQWEWEWRRCVDTPPSGHLRGCIHDVNTNPKHMTETQIHCSFTTIIL